jgi:hypothetical protein
VLEEEDDGAGDGEGADGGVGAGDCAFFVSCVAGESVGDLPADAAGGAGLNGPGAPCDCARASAAAAPSATVTNRRSMVDFISAA